MEEQHTVIARLAYRLATGTLDVTDARESLARLLPACTLHYGTQLQTLQTQLVEGLACKEANEELDAQDRDWQTLPAPDLLQG